jgi:hypothetical protein
MKKFITMFLLLSLSIILSFTVVGAATTTTGAAAAKLDKSLTNADMLTYAIQDEYLAQAEYNYVIKTFGNEKPFSSIVKAEQKHIDLLLPLFKKYKVTVPKNIASTLIPKPKTLAESLKAGEKAEVDNIFMYETFLKKSLPSDIKAVFTELRDGSKNHLNAFKNKQ